MAGHFARNTNRLAYGRVQDLCHLYMGNLKAGVFKPQGAGFVWLLSTVADALYTSGKTMTKKMANLQSIWGEVEAEHRKLWPGQPVPPQALVGTDDQKPVVPTSVVFSLLVWAMCAPKRSPKYRYDAANLLEGLIKRACDSKVELRFPVFDSDGILIEMRKQEMDENYIVNCWTESMSNALANRWDFDFLNDDIPYPRSSRSATLLHDFIFWALQPVPLSERDGVFRAQMACLSSTARTMLTHIAAFYETHILPHVLQRDARMQPHSSDSEHDFFSGRRELRKKRKRGLDFETNELASRAAKLLYSGKDFDCNVVMFSIFRFVLRNLTNLRTPTKLLSPNIKVNKGYDSYLSLIKGLVLWVPYIPINNKMLTFPQPGKVGICCHQTN